MLRAILFTPGTPDCTAMIFVSGGGQAFNMGGRFEVKGIAGWSHRLTDWLFDNGLLEQAKAIA